MLKPPAVRRRQPDGAGPTRPAGGAGEPGRDSVIERVLVIKLGALGDFVQALGPFAAIRRHHARAHITLLTIAPFVEFAAKSGYFDAVWRDNRPPPWAAGAWLALRRRLGRGGFERVYDLQTSDRTGFYHWLMGPGRRPEWSGIARGCSHPHANPRRDSMHTLERQAEQLAGAGIDEVPPPDLSWVEADTGRFGLSGRYVLMVPGGAAHRPAKRWPAADYAELARLLAGQGLQPVLLGKGAEAAVTGAVAARAPGARDLAGETSLPEIVALARQAASAVGNDTGAMQLIAVAGCPAVVLFSAVSDPALCAPRGPGVTVLRRDDLAELPVSEVAASMTLR